MKSIKFKLVLMFLTLVLFVMISSGVFIRISIQNSEASRIYEEMSNLAIGIEQEIIQTYIDHYTIAGEIALQPFDILQPGMQVEILNENGQGANGDFFVSSVIISAMAGNVGFNAWERAQGHDDALIAIWMSYAVPITVQATGENLILYLRQNVNSLHESLENTTITLAFSVALAMALATVVGTFFASTLTEPISALTKSSKEMAKGNLGHSIPVFSNDEIGQLTESFNHMGKSLLHTLESMNSDKTRMEIIIHSMTDGIIAFDKEKEIIHANQAAMEMTHATKITYKDILELLEIDDTDDASKDKVVEIDDKFIRREFTTYDNIHGEKDGTVIVMQDVTKQTKLDNMRKEFVANVSHEIRTPLTVIKTYAETLLDEEGIDDMARNFLNTINLEVDRMTLLAADLLELSHFDNKQLKIQNSQQDILKILHNSVKQTTIVAAKKNQTIQLFTETTAMPYYCDGGRINQVFVNIISNGIKYSPENTQIKITASQTDVGYTISIADNGIGIPTQDIEHIFERFYRVDKARSRAMGGIGLGLSIVKEILDLAGADINIKSRQGEGTEVIITFPIIAKANVFSI
ncbi:MAG: cell wall metabolism sensor histidine kinase WalK [Defluviitaleaceae bacterium]|nr:cell wall metabolism sensor histidine kinase WalK [Defluviitaleaceae bacterium]